ncbi:hypothetical protein NDU88_004091 [Pleurodeles waltl]|uniref:Uncharacterized protein n=1 Tax=Pleurodeles waltl TaxID=8319 RepID=A0AAV7TQB6_PLEWA|nr:hypothetical protein NDU88_004091 [Pleurodeles waltl]
MASADWRNDPWRRPQTSRGNSHPQEMEDLTARAAPVTDEPRPGYRAPYQHWTPPAGGIAALPGRPKPLGEQTQAWTRSREDHSHKQLRADHTTLGEEPGGTSEPKHTPQRRSSNTGALATGRRQLIPTQTEENIEAASRSWRAMVRP